MSRNKDMRKLIRAATKRGWVVDKYASKRTSHNVLRWKDGTRIFLSLTPSCHHAVKNAEADLRRVEKGVRGYGYRPKHGERK